MISCATLTAILLAVFSSGQRALEASDSIDFNRHEEQYISGGGEGLLGNQPPFFTHWQILRDGSYLGLVCYGNQDDRKWRIIQDGKLGPEFDSILKGSPILDRQQHRVAYAVRDGQGQRFVVDGRRQPRFDGVSPPSFQFSPDGKHFAYCAHKNSHWHVVVDSVASRPYDTTFLGGLDFSADSQSVAYRARVDGKSIVVVDGEVVGSHDAVMMGSPRFHADGEVVYVAREGELNYVVVGDDWSEAFTEISPGALLSPDRRRIAYSGVSYKSRKAFAFIDGKQGPLFDAASVPVFSQNSRHVAYVGTYGHSGKPRSHVMVDGLKGPAYDNMGDGPLMSASGKVSVYQAIRNRKWFVVKDGNEGEAFDGVAVNHPVFSKDETRFYYVAQKGGKQHVVIDGEKGPAFDQIIDGSLKFSSDASRVAYVGESNGKFQVVIDGKMSEWYEGVGEGHPIFSQDGKHVAFEVGVGEKQRVIVDETVGPLFDGIGAVPIKFSPNEGHFAYLAFKNNKIAVVVDHRLDKLYDDIIDTSIAFRSDGSLTFIARENEQLLKVTLVIATGE